MSDIVSPAPDSFDDHAATREGMRRDILRAHTVVALVLLAILTLALVAVFAGLRASENLRRAKAAEAEGRERLLKAYTAEARARRASAEPGGRQAALDAVTNAAAIRASPEVRTEAMACLAMSDLIQEGPLVQTRPDLERVLTDPELRFYVSAGATNEIELFSLTDGKRMATLPVAGLGKDLRRDLNYLSVSPNGQLLAARFLQGGIAVWNVSTRAVVFRHGLDVTNVPPAGKSFRMLTGMLFSRDSKKLIFNDAQADGKISIFDLASGECDVSAMPVWGQSFRMSPDLKEVAVASKGVVTIYRYPTGTRLHTLAHESDVSTMTWSEDGSHLAVSCDDGAIYLWEPRANIHRHLSGHSELAIRMGFSPDGRLFFSGSRDGSTRLWDVAQGRQIAAGIGLGHMMSLDGTRIGFWRPWEGFGAWKIAESPVYTPLVIDKGDGPLLGMDLSSHGRWCLASQDKALRLWNLSREKPSGPDRLPGLVYAGISADEKTLYACGNSALEAYSLDREAPGLLRSIPLPDHENGRGLALSQDGRWAAVELTDGRLFRIDLTQAAPPVAMRGRYRAVSFYGGASLTGAGRFAISPDGRWIATGSGFNNNTPTIWNGQTGELAAKLNATTSVVCFSPDGRELGLAGRARYSIWSVGDWKLVRAFTRDESSLANGAIAFTQDHSLLATARTRQSIQLRDGTTFEEIGALVPPTVQSVGTLRLAADGSTLASATPAGLLEIWRLNTLRGQLARMGLDWGAKNPAVAPEEDTASLAWPGPVLVFSAFILAATLIVLTLRRHRFAIERFVTAEAQAARRDRELSAARVELLRSQKMEALGTLAVGIAHDFNNLLSVVRMSSKLIGRESGVSSEVREHVADIERAVLQGKLVVSSMLGYARPSQTDGEPTDAALAVADAVSLLSKEFLSGITLVLEQAPDAPKVAIGHGPLEQILLNLIVNASEAMQGEGRLKITLRASPSVPAREYVLQPGKAGGYVELAVIDSGPGIAPAIRDRLFEPFFTTKRSSSKVGTGLGLSLVYSVARQNQLGLAVESEEGRGAMFCVVMPVAVGGVRQTHSAEKLNPA